MTCRCRSSSSFLSQPPLLRPHNPPPHRFLLGSRSSQYQGVTFYQRMGRWESHIWDCGKKVYLGGLTLLIQLQGLMIEPRLCFEELKLTLTSILVVTTMILNR